MLIELDLSEAKSLKLTINQFLLIKLLLNKVDIKSYQNVIHLNNADVELLVEKKILTKESLGANSISELKLDEEFSLLNKSKDFFDEFYDLYPVFVVRPDGTKDYLRGDISRCRKNYNSIVGKSKSAHKKMMNALKYDITNRKITNTMMYMKRMAKWLTSEEYLIYENEVLKDVKQEKVDTYGTAIE